MPTISNTRRQGATRDQCRMRSESVFPGIASKNATNSPAVSAAIAKANNISGAFSISNAPAIVTRGRGILGGQSRSRKCRTVASVGTSAAAGCSGPLLL